MKPKKYQKHNINRDSGLYFSLGLAIVMALIYFALEWKTYDSAQEWDSTLMIDGELLEDVPVTIHEIKPPPPRAAISPVIEITADDNEDIIETVIESTEPDSNTEVLTVEDIEVIEHFIDEEIPFIAIEEVPIFPGCENMPDKRACFQQMIHDHVKRNFQYPKEAIEIGLEGKVYIMFVIEKDGTIGQIRLRSPHQILEHEAERIISTIPVMVPGKQRGTAVKVSFSLPLTFTLQ